MINVLVNGASGKMGQEVIKELNALDNFNYVYGSDKNHSINSVHLKPDVIIDFSVPSSTLEILEYADKYKVPIVIATTGFDENQLNIINEYSKKIPIFKSSNMSYETNLVISLVSKLAKVLKDSDIEIIDVHHNKKIDSPSGTALMIADGINKALDNSMYYEFNRHRKKEARNKKEIGIHSLRGGTEVGKHSVFFFGDNESLEISHTVTSRAVFAKGSLKAAEFIITQGPGLYDMNDLIG